MSSVITADDISEMKPLLIRASAGTGKTYQLTGRLLRILLGGAAPDSVIATTFTRKAAGEILTRVMLSLARAAIDPSGVARQKLAEQTGLPDLSRDQCISMTHSLLRDVHRLRILTLDSLFSQLARSFSYEIGVPPGWRLTDEIEDLAVREAAVDAMLATLQPSEVSAILAQLGKGDTKRSVRNDMLRVIEEGYHVSRGCDKTAWDTLQVPRAPSDIAIKEALTSLAESAVGNKSADGYLRRLGEWIDIGDWDKVSDMELVAKMPTLRAGDAVIYYRKVMPDEIAKALRVASAGAKTHVLSLLRAQTLATARVIAAYETQVNEIKQISRAFSFDDIAYQLSESLSPVSMNQIANRIDCSIEHLLLDEFQDTSPVQWNVLKPLAIKTSHIDQGSFFCVGDTKQAIYGWRGGVAEIFDSVCEQISGVVQREQNTSFRSSPVVIDSVNLIFKNLTRHPDASSSVSGDRDHDSVSPMGRALSRFSGSFPTHEAAREDLSGYVTIRSSDVDPKDSSLKFPHLKFVADRIAETAAVAPNCSIGVLTRTNESVAWLIQLLRAKEVDVSQEGGNPLVDSPAVELVLSALMMPEHPGDKRWAFHVANSPLRKMVGLTDFNDSVAANHFIRRMIEDEGIARTVEELARAIVPLCDEGDALRLRQLVTLAQQFESRRGSRVSQFVQRVNRKRVEKPRPAQVRVMTIHQAKGLEFDVVVLPELDGDLVRPLSGTIGMQDKIDAPPKGLLRFIGQAHWPLLPRAWQDCFDEQVEAKYTEALCLLYVAVTRPRRWLDIIVLRSKHSQPKAKNASSLLYHAVGCECDATLANQTWFQAGDEKWYEAES